MRNIGIILLLLFTCNIQTKAQKYEEPQWKIPLYFEDATGAKDTIWIGYDPDATSGIDPQFDEGWMWIDTTEFNLYQWAYPNTLPLYGPIDTDSVRKTDISEDIANGGGRGGFVKGVLPVTLTWDEEKLNSPDLPEEWFPDISPRPRARIELWFDPLPGHTDPDCVVISDKPTLVLSSYPEGLEMYPCVKSNQAVFDNSNTNIPNMAFMIAQIVIKPHDYSYVSVNTIGNNMIDVFPNIFSNIFFITNKSNELLNFEIFTVSGKKILKGKIKAGQVKQNINMALYPQGIYFIKFSNNTNNFTSKLLKTQ
ncbi:MAG: T9SS type A sorting domain-containing protein [Bacteroidales bacterium]|nr:T9SS type A sorting domain-containing protein [Bacteroidales bacterium]